MSYLDKRKASFKFAGRGLTRLIREPNACIHAVAAVCVIAAGFIFSISATEWCLCILCIGAVFAAEGFNTALEALCDRVSPEKHPLIATAKDVAAGAVLITAIAAAAVGLIIFLPKIF